MKFDLEHGTAVLSRTPATLRAMLQGLPAEWLHRQYRDEIGPWIEYLPIVTR